MPPKRTDKQDGILPSQGKNHRSQEKETDVEGRSVERLVHQFDGEAVKEEIAISVGEGASVHFLMSMERNIRDDLKEMTKAFTTVMTDFMAEVKEWRKSSKEEFKSPEDEKLKEAEASLFKNHGQGSGISQAGENLRLEESPILESVREGKYTPPHKRDEEVWLKHQNYSNNKPMPGNIFAVTSSNMHPGMYGDGGMRGFSVPNPGNGTRGTIYSPHPLRQTLVLDFETVRDVIQELYGPGLRPISRPEFHKPYPDVIARDNPYPRGYRIPDFAYLVWNT